MPLILVTGATGLTGTEVVRRLSARGAQVRALVRNAAGSNAAKAAELSRLPGVEVAEGDMARPESLIAALRGVDRAMLISSSDAAMRDVQYNFIDAAASAGVSHVVKQSGIMPEIDSGQPWRTSSAAGRLRSTSSPGVMRQSSGANSHLRESDRAAPVRLPFRQVAQSAANLIRATVGARMPSRKARPKGDQRW
jgi:uncharacterized protein YbjT (DUF2867 family)